MSRFLKIIEQNNPSPHVESKRMMVSKLVELLDNLPGIDVKIIDHNTFTVSVNGNDITLDVRDIDNLNEAMYQPPAKTSTGASFNPTYNLDQGVEGLAAKALYKGPGSGMLGVTSAQQANQAVKKREAVAKKAIPVYNKITKDLEDAIKNAALYKTNPTVI